MAHPLQIPCTPNCLRIPTCGLGNLAQARHAFEKVLAMETLNFEVSIVYSTRSSIKPYCAFVVHYVFANAILNGQYHTNDAKIHFKEILQSIPCNSEVAKKQVNELYAGYIVTFRTKCETCKKPDFNSIMTHPKGVAMDRIAADNFVFQSLVKSAFHAVSVWIVNHKPYNGSFQMGVIPNIVDLLFASVKLYKDLGWSYNINVTLKVYGASTNLELIAFTVESPADLCGRMEEATSHRVPAATVGNERSHAVTQIKLTGAHHGRDQKCISIMNFIDLPVSESPTTSSRRDTDRLLKELNSIVSLVSENDHVHQKSKRKTLMFINLAPHWDGGPPKYQNAPMAPPASE